jgi:hypothetical protein
MIDEGDFQMRGMIDGQISGGHNTQQSAAVKPGKKSTVKNK